MGSLSFFVRLPSRAISHARGHLRVSRFAWRTTEKRETARGLGFWVIHWLTKNNTVWLTLLSKNWATHWMICRCMATLSVMPFDWLNNWLYCQRTAQHTEWLYSWLTDWIIDFTDLWLINWLPDRLREYWVIYWLTKILCDWLYCPWLNKTLNDLQMYLWLIDWKTDCTVQRLTNWLNNLWLAYCMTS